MQYGKWGDKDNFDCIAANMFKQNLFYPVIYLSLVSQWLLHLVLHSEFYAKMTINY